MCAPEEHAEIMRFQISIFTVEICSRQAETPAVADELIAMAVALGPSKIEQERYGS